MAEKIEKKKILGTGSTLGNMLSEERIEELAQLEATKEKIASPKTKEGKKKSLRNLRTNAPKDFEYDENDFPDIENLPDKENLPISYMSMHKVLDEEERAYYIRQWVDYGAEFEMNTSADESLLHKLVLEAIVYNRLVRNQLSNPGTDLSKQMSECSKRHGEALKNLGISRTQRLGSKTGTEDNIASLVQAFDKDKIIEIETIEKEYESEEDELLRRKQLEIDKEFEEIKAVKEKLKDGNKEEAIPHAVTKQEWEEQAPKVTKLTEFFDEAALK
jgi:hypothetical protein